MVINLVLTFSVNGLIIAGAIIYLDSQPLLIKLLTAVLLSQISTLALHNSMNKQISLVANYIEKIANGHVTATLPKQVNLEFARLGDSVDHMSKDMKV